MTHPPSYILLENVKGFEESDSRDLLVEALSESGYEFQEMLITPLQIGIPNSRMRYYCLARKTEKVGSFVHQVTGTLIGYIPSLDTQSRDVGSQGDEEGSKAIKFADFVDVRKQGDQSGLSTPVATKKRRTSLSTSIATKGSEGDDDSLGRKPDENAILADPMLALKVGTLDKYIEFMDVEDERMKRYMIPDKTLLKYGRLFDIVKATTRRSCCFTKGKARMKRIAVEAWMCRRTHMVIVFTLNGRVLPLCRVYGIHSSNDNRRGCKCSVPMSKGRISSALPWLLVGFNRPLTLSFNLILYHSLDGSDL